MPRRRTEAKTPVNRGRLDSPDWVVNSQSTPGPARTGTGPRFVIPRVMRVLEPTSVASTWDLSLKVWPLEDRPEELQNKYTVNSMTLPTLFTFKQHYDPLQKKEGKGDTEFGLDRKLPSKIFKEEEDNTADKLHTVR